MISQRVEIVQQGDDRGNNMILKLRLASGAAVFGLATKNTYGGEWDLGPTWNYLVCADRPFLVDTGRHGMGGVLLGLMERIGFKGKDLDHILLSHGHEDHDGGAYEIMRSTGVRLKAHEIYGRLIHIYPDKSPSKAQERFPASCWHCPMPPEFSSTHCLEYHKEQDVLEVDEVRGASIALDKGITAYHVPGHAPDALAVAIEDELLLAGDTILPDITPHPTREEFYRLTKPVLQPHYDEAQAIYGLRAYIRSLKKLKQLAKTAPGICVLPAHRLYYGARWNDIDLEGRVDELIEHHVQRCADILALIREQAKTGEQIAREYFDPSLLAGAGMHLGINEILSHCELLEVAGDVLRPGGDGIVATGSTRFESCIRAL